MHSDSEMSPGVPAFLAKLWKLVEDPETNHLICWSPNGKSFFIRNQAQFSKDLLPHYFKHSNMASFVRQLNMYGFHKKASVELGGLKCDKDEMEFAHQYFCKGHYILLQHIKRKIATNKNQDKEQRVPFTPEVINELITEVTSMKSRQEHLDSKWNAMKEENATLWRELAVLRQKHIKQQQLVNKLIQFLVTVVQSPSRGNGLSVKRRYPLMIDDSNLLCNKHRKVTKPQASPTGPVIHELDAELDVDSAYIASEILENKSPTVHSPQEHIDALVNHQNMEDVNLTDCVQLPDNIDNIQLIDNPCEINMIDMNSAGKAKKKLNIVKKKKKVPIKVLIPPLENGEKPREEMHLLEIPIDEEPVTIPLLKPKSAGSKAIPIATMRSPKLAAMAANMAKLDDDQNEQDDDDETSVDIEENIEESSYNDTPMKLEDILIVPETFENATRCENDAQDEGDSTNEPNQANNRSDETNLFLTSDDQQFNEKRVSQSSQNEIDNNNEASTSASNDLSLSCIISPNICADYREQMNHHVETMQNDLNNINHLLNGNFNIDANVALNMMPEDPITYELSITPELHQNYDESGNNKNGANSLSESVGGELMAYTPPTNILDFGDMYYMSNADYLDVEDSKALLLDSLNANSQQ